jgi:hypothetical protein
MLGLVVELKAVVSFVQVFRNIELVAWRCERPEVGTQDHDCEIDIVRIWSSLLSLLELLRQVLAETHIWKILSIKTQLLETTRCPTREHPLQLVRVLETTRFLEFGYHARLGLLGRRNGVNKAFRQLRAIKGLEDILVLDVFEDDHLDTGIIRAANTQRPRRILTTWFNASSRSLSSASLLFFRRRASACLARSSGDLLVDIPVAPFLLTNSLHACVTMCNSVHR